MTATTAAIVKQDFGYSATNFAGKARGEMGGTIQRAGKPASYAAALAPAKTLEDKLSASGSLFDRFGLFGIGTGGGQVKIYLDDLTYSAAKP